MMSNMTRLCTVYQIIRWSGMQLLFLAKGVLQKVCMHKMQRSNEWRRISREWKKIISKKVLLVQIGRGSKNYTQQNDAKQKFPLDLNYNKTTSFINDSQAHEKGTPMMARTSNYKLLRELIISISSTTSVSKNTAWSVTLLLCTDIQFKQTESNKTRLGHTIANN